MRRAAELLKQTSHPVSEICYMVDIQIQRYFGQSFKKEFGMTPKQYSIRKRYRNKITCLTSADILQI
jgi:YesN/AraC family two-component response regulator